MSLLESMKETCTLLTRESVPEETGGFRYEWREGEQFSAVIIKGAMPVSLTAEMKTPTEDYSVITGKCVTLNWHDVFRRESDGATFRVTGQARDNEAPAASSIQIRKVSAERWELTE